MLRRAFTIALARRLSLNATGSLLAEDQDWLDGERSLIGRRRRENDWDATTALDARTG
jgi:hypothetical protein